MSADRPFERTAPPDRLDDLWINLFGDARELHQVSVSPSENWGGKGPYLSFSLHSPRYGSAEEYAKVSRAEAVRLHTALGAWLDGTAPAPVPPVPARPDVRPTTRRMRKCPACQRSVPTWVRDGAWTFGRHIQDMSLPPGEGRGRKWCVNSDVVVSEALAPNADGTYSTATGGTMGGTPAPPPGRTGR